MLNSSRHDVLFRRWAASGQSPKSRDYRPSVPPLTNTTSLGSHPSKAAHLTPCHLQALFGDLAVLMDTGCVSIHFNQRWNQYFEYRWRYGRGGVVVEVETLHFN